MNKQLTIWMGKNKNWLAMLKLENYYTLFFGLFLKLAEVDEAMIWTPPKLIGNQMGCIYLYLLQGGRYGRST